MSALMILSITAFGDGFLDDDLDYRFEDGSATRVYVWGLRNSTTTSITIPQTVVYEYTDPNDTDEDGRSKTKYRTCTVTRIDSNAFYNRSMLTSVTIQNGITNIGNYAFCKCSSLMGNLNIPDSVMSIGVGAFAGCAELTRVSIPEGVKEIAFTLFSGCSGMTSMTIPATVTNIGEHAFYGCSGLTSVAITYPIPMTSIAVASTSPITFILCSPKMLSICQFLRENSTSFCMAP